jgi:hypothetical protein
MVVAEKQVIIKEVLPVAMGNCTGLLVVFLTEIVFPPKTACETSTTKVEPNPQPPKLITRGEVKVPVQNIKGNSYNEVPKVTVPPTLVRLKLLRLKGVPLNPAKPP